ncbi:AfsR/SARP family transcriptional regulator [Micromonospora foliorum]|uniref:AfsR/SARP family transcriptional regulator n=1 Tax=Micromonospora foliorum TaxID=2911210 RepID=UPI001EE9979D|nr:AfsR/SARP family transcriptional regulator [Micromonospora foliorum]MCG5435245.1 tetratricopeptide repeat protein [Micromonospora foliorum]
MDQVEDGLQFRLLGPVGVWHGVRRLGPSAAQHRTVLAVLALECGNIVSIDRLVTALWGTAPPASARNAVQGCVSRLRTLLNAVDAPRRTAKLVVAGQGYRLVADRSAVDLHEFRDLLRTARTCEPEEARELVDRALRLWRGPALADVGGPWLDELVAPQLNEERFAALELRADLDLELGRFGDIVDGLADVVADNPARERLALALLVALHRCGRRVDALALFRRVRERLAGELGIEPGEELQQAHRAVLAGVEPSPGSARYRPREPAGEVPRQLPAAAPGFVGRQRELTVLHRLLEAGAPRVAVVCGPAGAGKTSLAVHWAHLVQHRFPDGQLFVDMRGFHPGPRRSPAEALPLLLGALGVASDRIPAEADAQVALYRSALAGRRVLLVLDNVADAGQVRPLVPGGPGCLTMVTSRDRLSGLIARDGAARLTLDVLPAADAVELLARTAGADRIEADPAAAQQLAEICGHLPLALRIAGARLADRAHLSVRGHVDELIARGRVAQLRVDDDDSSAVRGAFELSYQALPAPAGRLFRLLGLVPAPAGLAMPAAAALAGLPHEDVESLVDALTRLHLIRITGTARIVSHDLLLEYGAQLAAEHDAPADRAAAVRRLLHFYLHAVARATAALNGPSRLRLPQDPPPPGVPVLDFDDQTRAREWLEAESANLVGALEHAVADGHYRPAWQLAHAMYDFLRMRTPLAQWRSIARAGLEAARRDGDLRGEAVMRQSLGLLSWRTGDLRAARVEYEAVAALADRADWRVGASAAHCSIGIALAQLGRPRAAIGRFERALAIDREVGDRRAEAGTLTNLAAACEEVGDLAAAARYGELAIALLRETGQHMGAAIASENLALVGRELGRLDGARAAAEEAVRICRTIGARHEEAAALTALGRVHGDAGRYAQAEDVLNAGLDIVLDLRDSRLEAFIRIALAEVLLRQDRPSESGHRLEPVLAVVDRAGNERARVEALMLLSELCAARKEFDSAREHATHAVAAARAGGYRLVAGQARSRLAAAYLGLGDLAGCLAEGRRALRIQRRAGQRMAYARTLVTVACAYEALGRASLARARSREAHALFREIGAAEAALLG